jgi:hypothetical protein
MFRFWAGATAGFLIGTFGVSGVFAEEFGSSVTPFFSSQSNSAYSFADANFSSRDGVANLWGGASGFGFAKASDVAAGAPSFTFIDFASSSLGDGSSPMSFAVGSTVKSSPRMADSRTAVDTYFGVFESLSKQGLNGSGSGASFIAPVGAAYSAGRPLR